MTRNRNGTHAPRPRPFPTILAGAIGVGVFLLAATIVPVAGASAAWSPDPVSWNNGSVLCQFLADQPGVNVSALARNGSGLTTGLRGVSEIDPSGAVVASAALSGLSWNSEKIVTEDFYDLAFTAVAPVDSSASGAPTVGSVDLRVDFVLPAYEGSPSGDYSMVTVQVSVANWSWQAAGDSLALSFSASPTFPSAEHLQTATAPGEQLASASTSSGQTFEWMGLSTTAAAASATGPAVNVSATPSLGDLSSTSAVVGVAFGSAAGAFQSLVFTAHVGVVLPSSVAGIPTVDLVAVGAAAVAGSLGIAAATRRVRSRPSRLIYVDDEEP